MPQQSDPNPPLFSRLRTLSHLSAPLPQLPPATSAYIASLEAATKSLRRELIDEELQIASLQPQLPEPAAARPHLLSQIRANRELFATPGYLPPAASPLNTLLALRKVQRTITDNTSAIPRAREELLEAQNAVAAARSQLAEQNQLKEALQRRVEELRRPVDEGGDRAEEARVRAKELQKRTATAMKALQRFFREHLVRLLEVEELGGPVAEMGREQDGERITRRRGGGQMTLEEAFRAGRRREKEREGRKRKRRGEKQKGDDEEEEEEEDEEDGEGDGDVQAEMLELVLDLMNKSLEADSYITLKQERAVARFLVRARVAELHPRDARRIRLVNFGGRFEE